ncbi:MAG: hypothetical protein UIM26_03935 [Longicatena sp.]|nr:hypothetical protein [Longicatena sp.]
MKIDASKINDKNITSHLFFVISTIVMCLIAMTVTAYAYFSHDITSTNNVIETSQFDVKIVIQNLTDDSIVDVKADGDATYSANLKQGNIYLIKIEKAGTASNGFCVVSASESTIQNYHTQQLGEDKNTKDGKRDSLEFTVVANKDSKITFFAHWGTSSKYKEFVDDENYSEKYIVDGQKFEIGEKVLESIKKEEPVKVTKKKPNKTNTKEEPKEDKKDTDTKEESSQSKDEEVNDKSETVEKEPQDSDEELNKEEDKTSDKESDKESDKKSDKESDKDLEQDSDEELEEDAKEEVQQDDQESQNDEEKVDVQDSDEEVSDDEQEDSDVKEESVEKDRSDDDSSQAEQEEIE